MIEDVRTSYYRAVSAQRLLTKLSELQSRSPRRSTIRSGSPAAASPPPLIALTYQRELIDIEAQVKSLCRELQIAKAQLAALMNLDPGTDYELVLPPREDALPAVNRSARRRRDRRPRCATGPSCASSAYQERINQRELDAQILSHVPEPEGVRRDQRRYQRLPVQQQLGAIRRARRSFNLLNVFRLGAVKKSVRAQGDAIRPRNWPPRWR